ncbi:MAG: hypothetical protein RM021_003870 [Nostoc sp. EkiNYC01]|nr:hypothetical protein [Nostoc sp. EkiNYC01]
MTIFYSSRHYFRGCYLYALDRKPDRIPSQTKRWATPQPKRSPTLTSCRMGMLSVPQQNVM